MASTKYSKSSSSAHLDFAHLLADQSAKAILPHFRKIIAVDDKGTGRDYDPVTAADRNAERVISRLIAKEFPEHGLVGEEFGSRNAEAQFRWVIDPIDGTRAFIMGQPLWGTLIGLLDGDQPVLGMMNQPFTGERFWGSARGAFLRRGAASRRLTSRESVTALAGAVSHDHASRSHRRS